MSIVSFLEKELSIPLIHAKQLAENAATGLIDEVITNPSIVSTVVTDVLAKANVTVPPGVADELVVAILQIVKSRI